ncbi:hypothetical protein EN836_26615 [Mesorhizobium sp. M1C.F.Ca.ET.193.01.1.1]|nr:hypothetical protein EN853_26610 [Mesorhizobium sp. M1C.F.Ca.ET.210.01.1.1]TGQ66438.1 hypothetical protein EN855_026620 [Mesorhizobium sp. M1C.F.Ca.ET.212.01.1.1]TGR00524.1 hypothetical protein EN847_26610 [Mesorhizobium sp. M1C.F.Ca.ET.204.01.1.1]TGR21115.1 hypothetical protein EN839_26610 [Mesorhizobium sp. M1C.F.Ca.ET.196.01.1.1]TGR43833.1 hypothetical protein EN838_26610 [Mesorhizobium sp. M1C.F.Ca.ET.195.01.1.1]TGR61974.1 hypothetical protein EN835_026605 [Mesorhizobium sp. M1C.F.Ca.ET
MPRYATIITADDGAEIVSAIGEFESCGLPRSTRCVEEVAPGVLMGMMRGGPVEAVAGFGFPRQGLPHSAIAAVTATLKAAAPAPKLPISPEVGEMSGRTEGGAVPPTLAIGTAASDQVDRTPPPKPARAKPRKKPARKAARARKVSSAGALAVANG